MKKFLVIIVGLVILLVGGYKIMEQFIMGGDDYYVKITTDGKKMNLKDQEGKPHIDYTYELPAYDKQGTEKTVTFNGNKDRPLRKDAYLKLTINANKGVTSYEEVAEKDVPQKALTKLNQ